MERIKNLTTRTKAIVVVSFLFGIIALVSLIAVLNTPSYPEDPAERAKILLQEHPLIDAHNDLPWEYRKSALNNITFIDISKSEGERPSFILDQTDIPRLKEGQIGGQFWSVYVSCEYQYKDAVRATLEQIDVVWNMQERYPDVFEVVVQAKNIYSAFKKGKIGSLIGMEGGHSIDSSLGSLRMFYKLGVRYMTLTHNCNTPWAQANNDYSALPISDSVSGLTIFGEKVIQEMNRLGFLVDLSHVSEKTMSDVLQISSSPVIFSHSNAKALCNVSRNVPDDILLKLKENNGLICITFVGSFLKEDSNQNPATIDDVSLIGVDHVGIGSDYDGTSNVPIGLEDVSKFPSLVTKLLERYSDSDVIKMIGKNLIRVLTQNEWRAEVLQKVEKVGPLYNWFGFNTTCRNKN